MNLAILSFWSASFFVLYTYLIYPISVYLLASIRSCTIVCGPYRSSVSVVVAALNEEATIYRRLSELADMIVAAGLEGEIILASDGSTDRTAEIGRTLAQRGVRVIEWPGNMGKAAALTKAVAEATGQILVFADARQTWAPDAMSTLLENFNDPRVAAVSGDLVVRNADGVMVGMGMYWRYEKWLRCNEGRLYSTVGVTGAISAVRRSFFLAIPPGTILDDVYWPMQVVLQGSRVVHDPRARAYDCLPEKVGSEFQRKVRTLSGNFQLVMRAPALLSPLHNPIWIQFLSHKIFRLLVPWALLAMLYLAAWIGGPIYRGVFWAQIGFYAVGAAGTWDVIGKRSRVAAVASSFVVLNAAAWVAFWVWITNRTGSLWRKVSYEAIPTPEVHHI